MALRLFMRKRGVQRVASGSFVVCDAYVGGSKLHARTLESARDVQWEDRTSTV